MCFPRQTYSELYVRQLKWSRKRVPLVHFIFDIIFLGFNGGNITTLVPRGLQNKKNIRVPCGIFKMTENAGKLQCFSVKISVSPKVQDDVFSCLDFSLLS